MVFCLFIVLSIGSVAASARTSETETGGDAAGTLNSGGKQKPVRLDADYLTGFITDTRDILTSPLRWGKSGWIKASIAAGITLGLYSYDQEIQDWVQDHRNGASDEIANYAEPFGNGMFILPSLGGVYLYSRLYKDERAGRVALLGLKSVIISGLITNTIKFAGHRHRPDSGDGHDVWDGPGVSASDLSFPSGHATSAFSLASVIASEYEDKAYVPPLSYGIAALTALSRVNDNKHWASDVFMGSVIGYATGKTIYALQRSRNTNLAVIPVIERNRTLVLVTLRWH